MRGFTLVELIIFIVIAAIVIPAFFISTSPVVRDALVPTAMIKARFLGESKIEEIMAYPIDALPAQQSAYTYVDTTNFPGYQWRWEYECVTCGVSTNPDCSTYTGTTIVNLSGAFPPCPRYQKISVYVKEPQGGQYEAHSMVTRR